MPVPCPNRTLESRNMCLCAHVHTHVFPVALVRPLRSLLKDPTSIPLCSQEGKCRDVSDVKLYHSRRPWPPPPPLSGHLWGRGVYMLNSDPGDSNASSARAALQGAAESRFNKRSSGPICPEAAVAPPGRERVKAGRCVKGEAARS